VLIGAPAVAALARLFPTTWIIGYIASLPGFSILARLLYGWIASNRYTLSRCRGGVCQSARADLLEKASWRAFQLCRAVGLAMISSLSLAAYLRRIARHYRSWRRTRGRALELFDGRLTIYFLSGGLSSTVSLLFGELFTAIGYQSLVVDPGGTRMRRSALRHLWKRKIEPKFIVPTHAHEEHCGNLKAVARATGAQVLCFAPAIPLVVNPSRIPLMRRLAIGQPEPAAEVESLPPRLRLDDGTEVVVIPTPGHCAEHVSLYIPRDKLLIVGDAFMGTHFSSPNDDVDHRLWIAALERLLSLDIETMVEAHGHVHTVRSDVVQQAQKAGLSCIVNETLPRELLRSKLEFLRWIEQQIELGKHEGLPLRGLQATIFPWTQRWSYEALIQDSFAALVSGRAFGRHKVVRSFRAPLEDGLLPTVFELRWVGDPAADLSVRGLPPPPSPPSLTDSRS
jgi:glyoxylase-like metal-dependent hydrolase (beta-lactamase superfamily II)